MCNFFLFEGVVPVASIATEEHVHKVNNSGTLSVEKNVARNILVFTLSNYFRTVIYQWHSWLIFYD